ncbi:hypothetical protein C8R45DRAFT_991089 [Mycena sanguinolenta]|nr:hypothetical protein C8R45DRAFT_991089 [Mycena sanguinolenta]
MTFLQYPAHRPTIVTNALIFGSAVFACAPLLLTSKVYPLQYLLFVARLLFSFTTPLVSQERLLLRIYLVAHVTIDVCAGVLAISSGPTGPLSASPSPSLVVIVVPLSVGTAIVSFYLLLMVSTAAEEDVKFPLPSSRPRMQIVSSDWVTLFTRLSVMVIFLAVAVGFTLGPFFMPSHSPALFDYLCFALRLILLFASPVLNRDTSEKTTIWDITPTMQNAVILQCVLNIGGLFSSMVGKGKFIEDLFVGTYLVLFAGTIGELLVIALMCYAGDEAEKLYNRRQREEYHHGA